MKKPKKSSNSSEALTEKDLHSIVAPIGDLEGSWTAHAGEFDVTLTVTVRVSIKDSNVILRCTENHDGWQEHLYPLRSRGDVLHHLAFNCVRNGCDNLRGLDGWADLPSDAAVMWVTDVEHERVDEILLSKKEA